MAKYAVGYITVLLIGIFVAGALIGPTFGPIRGEIRAVPGPAMAVPPPDFGGGSDFPVNVIVTGSHGRAFEAPHSAHWESTGSSQGMESVGGSFSFLPVYNNTEQEPLGFTFEVAWDISLQLYDDKDCMVFEAFYPGTGTIPSIEAIGPPGLYRLELQGNHRQGHASWTIGIENQFDDLWRGDC